MGFSVFLPPFVGSAILGVTCGIVGCFALLRNQSLLSDGLAHASLPGVCLAFLLLGERKMEVLLLGAFCSALLGGVLFLVIIRGSRIKDDAAIAIILSVMFGLGVVLLTIIQRSDVGNQAGLDHFILGQAATILWSDVRTLAWICGTIIVVVFATFKELRLICFDRTFGTSIGYSSRLVDVLLTLLTVVAVVIGLQTVGAILIVAALIFPAATSRQWTNRLGPMLTISASLGALCSMMGVWASSLVPHLPTGPMIVISAATLLIMSLLFSRERGIVPGLLRRMRVARRIRRENLLKDLYTWAERKGDPSLYLAIPEIMGIRGWQAATFHRLRRHLLRIGFIEQYGNRLRLAEQGMKEAKQVVRRHRLWELYLATRLEIRDDHVHRDAEQMEHVLSERLVAEFEEQLGHPKKDPHGREIPPSS